MQLSAHGRELDLLDSAVDAVRRETGLHLHVEHRELDIGGHRIDAQLRIEPQGPSLHAQVKRWAAHVNQGALVNQIKQMPEPALLVADYVNPPMAGALRRQGVQFIDTTGNAYVNQPSIYVYRSSGRPTESIKPPMDNLRRVFEPKGLMIVYAILCAPELIAATYRHIAEQAGVAVGTVSIVLNGLKESRLIRDRGRTGGRQLTDYSRLLERWVEAYPERLRPKLWLGAYIPPQSDWWKHIETGIYDAHWGGEIAGAAYTDFLKPQMATVYLPQKHLNAFLKDNRLRRATKADALATNPVQIYQPFWPHHADDAVPHQTGLVPPVLAYADLVATGDPRNMEVAERIFDEYLAEHCRKA